MNIGSGDRILPVVALLRDSEDDIGIRRFKLGAFGKIALAFFAAVPAAGTEQLANFVGRKFVELVASLNKCWKW